MRVRRALDQRSACTRARREKGHARQRHSSRAHGLPEDLSAQWRAQGDRVDDDDVPARCTVREAHTDAIVRSLGQADCPRSQHVCVFVRCAWSGAGRALQSLDGADVLPESQLQLMSSQRVRASVTVEVNIGILPGERGREPAGESPRTESLREPITHS